MKRLLLLGAGHTHLHVLRDTEALDVDRFEAATLQRLADLNEKSALGTIQRWNATASRLKPEQLRDLGMSPIEMPAGSQPPGAAPKLSRNPDGSYIYNP